MPSTDPIPVTVLTGFLGSGKTTLLNRLLAEAHGQRLAVIENEFGEVNIDSAILVRDAAAEIVQTENGCLCCTVRGDLRRALTDLAEQRAAGTLAFDRVIIETTGLAQPAPVVQTILIDPALGAHYRLDGVVTLVDAKHGDAQLDTHVEAQEQVGFADRLVISKPDLVSDETREALEARLKDMNPRAAVRVARFGDAPLGWVTDVGGFDASTVLDLHPGFPRYTRPAEHTRGVESFIWRSSSPFDRERFEFLLRMINQWYGPDLLRYKGILEFEGDPVRWVFQGVHRQQTLTAGSPWVNGEPRGSVLVFIGVGLPREVLGQGLDKCLAGAAV
jgi:G3E family GTPase